MVMSMYYRHQFLVIIAWYEHISTVQTVAENSTLVFNATNNNLLSVLDSDNGAIQVTLTVSNGNLTLASTSALSGLMGNGTANVSFSGVQADINTALNGLQYQYTGPNLASATTNNDALVINIDDLAGRTDTYTANIEVQGVN